MSTEAALHWFLAWGRAARFAFAVVAAVLSPKLYTPRARMATTRQIYFTAWQVLPGFTLFATLLGLVVVEITLRAAWQFGLEQYALELIFRALVLELMPLLTALFVALRSGAAISSEIALMRIAGEFEDLPSAGIEPFEREFVPRVAAAATSVFALTTLACVFLVALSYLLMYGPSPWGFDPFTREHLRLSMEGLPTDAWRPRREVRGLWRGSRGDPDLGGIGRDARPEIGAGRGDGRNGAAVLRARIDRDPGARAEVRLNRPQPDLSV